MHLEVPEYTRDCPSSLWSTIQYLLVNSLSQEVELGTMWGLFESHPLPKGLNCLSTFYISLCVNENLYFCYSTLGTVECYSPTSDRWHYVASLPSPRYGVAVTAYRGRLWVAGGFPEEHLAETSTVPRDVICYNVFRDEYVLNTCFIIKFVYNIQPIDLMGLYTESLNHFIC